MWHMQLLLASQWPKYIRDAERSKGQGVGSGRLYWCNCPLTPCLSRRVGCHLAPSNMCPLPDLKPKSCGCQSSSSTTRASPNGTHSGHSTSILLIAFPRGSKMKRLRCRQRLESVAEPGMTYTDPEMRQSGNIPFVYERITVVLKKSLVF